MKQLGNYLGLQVLWLIAVGSAAHARIWPTLLALAVFALYQLWPSRRAPGDVQLMVAALSLGLLLDTTLAAGSWVRYATPWPGSLLAPPWILALWLGFALTLNHSLAAAMQRPWLAVLLGAIFGPFSYWLAQRGWHAVEFQSPSLHAVLAVGIGWGVACGVLSLYARRLARPLPDDPAGELQ
ncbi:DUF2878 domain-containing protein [Xanthomonas citri]|uniref:DUF2878 domain-containing protein n=1 Tax=Xanthomonas citri TaxID=346 RepID=UPI0001CED1C1|nr:MULTISPECIES: DUF2878 domain-containing protein [Xanthomonas]AMV05995.1 membrane protein [Xanthomonas citri pv. aurantifolii]ARE58113.1 membrane protein [Xanthomonas citri pv. aurantifolii]EFF42925.1 conserved hypothetical protein [Xanthomonas citri pv. aurantifolii str. ICPB 11122]MCT8357212.1 DUF2878 domain-containing protein [Xanthomonas citri pv. anacardii]MCT8361203.1 DUF2878 domain-containing protein [Xanthomonas citri pv. anacardii]